MVSQMLRKSQQARPSLERCKIMFDRISTEAPKHNRSAFLHAVKQVEENSARAEAALEARQNRLNQWALLVGAGTAAFEDIILKLFNEIKTATSQARFSNGSVQLGSGAIGVSELRSIPGRDDGRPNCRQSGWDIRLYCFMNVARAGRALEGASVRLDPRPQLRTVPFLSEYRWTATLMFACAPNEENFRWWELSFYNPRGVDNEPFAIAVDDRAFDTSLAHGIGEVDIAYGPQPIDAEDEESFVSRWLILLGRASTGELSRPDYFPIDENYFLS